VEIVGRLRDTGVTIILTTHYIEEAEEIADRVGVISDGKLLLIEEKQELMQKLGQKKLIIDLKDATSEIPETLASYNLVLSKDGTKLTYSYDTRSERTGITSLMKELNRSDLELKDLQTKQSSLEDIFVNLLREGA